MKNQCESLGDELAESFISGAGVEVISFFSFSHETEGVVVIVGTVCGGGRGLSTFGQGVLGDGFMMTTAPSVLLPSFLVT